MDEMELKKRSKIEGYINFLNKVLNKTQYKTAEELGNSIYCENNGLDHKIFYFMADKKYIETIVIKSEYLPEKKFKLKRKLTISDVDSLINQGVSGFIDNIETNKGVVKQRKNKIITTKKWTKEDDDLIIKMKTERHSNYDIAKALGCKESHISVRYTKIRKGTVSYKTKEDEKLKMSKGLNELHILSNQKKILEKLNRLGDKALRKAIKSHILKLHYMISNSESVDASEAYRYSINELNVILDEKR